MTKVAHPQYRNLDVLRAFAVFFVVVCHASLSVSHAAAVKLHLPIALGRFGVDLFFFHTSYVLMQSLASLDPAGKGWAMNFYVRRAFRIYPLAALVIIFALVLRTPYAPWDGPAPSGLGIRGLALNFLLVENLVGLKAVISPMWSLPIEVQMYVLLPLIFLALKFRRWAAIVAGLWLLNIILAIAMYRALGNNIGLLAFAPCFLCGPIAWKLRSRPLHSWSSGFWMPAFLGVTAVFLAFSVNILPLWKECIKEWSLLFVLAMLFPRIRDMNDGWTTGVCHFIAKYSYGIYLWHLFGIWVSFHLLPLQNPYIRLALAVLITLAASIASYHAVEAPAIELGKRIVAARHSFSEDTQSRGAVA